MNRGNIHSPSVAEECEGRGEREGGGEGGRKRDSYSSFGLVWVREGERRAGVSISPKIIKS